MPDQYLSNRLKDKDYVDPRNSLVFWARPPEEVLNLATRIQAIIKEVMPCKVPTLYYIQDKVLIKDEAIWLMPREDMHTTVLEVVHSVTMEEVMDLANKLAPIIDNLIALPKREYGCTLFKPMVSFDAAAIALSFVPCGETAAPPPHQPPTPRYGASRTPSQTPSMDFSARPSISSTPGPPTPACPTTIDSPHVGPRTIADLTQTVLTVPPWHTNPSYHQMYSQSPSVSMFPPSQNAPPPYATQGIAYPPAIPPPIPGSQYSSSASQSNLPLTAYKLNLPSAQPSHPLSHLETPPSTSHSQKTYHHLRASLHSRITAFGVPITSRYVVPSAHITLARYVTSSASSALNADPRKSDYELSHQNLVCLVHTIELINAYLSLPWELDSLSALSSYERIELQAREVLSNASSSHVDGPLLATSLRSLEVRAKLSEMGEVRWDVEDELVCRVGDLWYGGGFPVKTPEKGRVWKRGGAGTWWECGRNGTRGRALGGRGHLEGPLVGKARERSAEGVGGRCDDEELRC